MLPKFMMWSIWKERNHWIFNDKAQGPVQVAIKTQVLMGKNLREFRLPKNEIELTMKNQTG